MILNGRDLATAQASIAMLKSRCDRLRRRIANPHEAALAALEVGRLEERIDDLTTQLRAYVELQTRVKIPGKVALIAIPDSLIQRRIHLGWTQTQLAEAVGQSRQMLSGYESTRYASVTLRRLIQIDVVLSAEEVRQRLPHEVSLE